jgi:5-methylcytosine-specific restriction endonuclease McrA
MTVRYGQISDPRAREIAGLRHDSSMPRTAVRPCLVHRCPQYAIAGESYCRAHLYRRAERGLTGARGTSAYWRKIRKMALQAAHFRCAECHRRSTELADGLHVHHADGDVTNNAPENLVVLCKEHHQARHRSKLKV